MKTTNFGAAASALCIALLMTGCSKSPGPEPAPALAAPAKVAPTPVHAAATASNAREKECSRTGIVWPSCYIDGWNGDSPRTAALSASTSSRKQTYEGLGHVLEQGELRHVDTVYDRTTGACGEVVQASGVYQGSTYSGTFFCNKTHFLSVPSDLPERTASSENFLVGRWLRSEEGSSTSKPELQEFRPDGTVVESAIGFTKESTYKFFGPTFAVLNKGESKWWIYRIVSTQGGTIRFENANPGDLKSTMYVLRPDPAAAQAAPVVAAASVAPVAPAAAASSLPPVTAVAPALAPAPATQMRGTPQPSFDCAKAASATEKLICSDAELAQLDTDLATVYRAAKASAPDLKAFNADSRAAFKERESKCSDKPCLLAWYALRRQHLQAR